MTLYPVLSALLGYPEAPLQAAMPEIEQALDASPARAAGQASSACSISGMAACSGASG